MKNHAVNDALKKYRTLQHVSNMEPVQRFEPSLQKILRGLPLPERDALIVLINNHARELSAQSVGGLVNPSNLSPSNQTAAQARATLKNLVARKLAVEKLGNGKTVKYQVAPDVMKQVRE